MYDPSKLSELIRFARVDAGSTVIDVYPGDGDWTRRFSDVVGPEGRVYSFVPTEVAHFLVSSSFRLGLFGVVKISRRHHKPVCGTL